MELYQLNTFVIVAEEGHLTRAAERLHASQPTVSAHIKALEDELDTRLFIRTPKGMQLTEAGERLHRKAEEVLAAARSMKIEARNMGGELVGDLSMGLNTDAEYLRIVPLLTSLAEEHPKITLQIQQSGTTSVQGAIRSSKLDCGFIFGPPRHKEIYAVHLETTRFFVAVPDIWKDHIPHGIKALAEFPWIIDPNDNPLQAVTESFFESRNITLKHTLEVDGDEVMRVLVAAGKGISFLRENELMLANRIGEVHAVPFEELDIDLHFVCLARKEQDPVMKAVIDHVKGVWSEPV